MTAALNPQLIERLLAAARDAQARAHAPYSHFPVGAAVLDESGRIHAGCNVENAAYPLGLCAEALAIATMVREGGKSVRAVLVLGDGEKLVTPCGGCRQRLREFAADAAPVLIADKKGVRAQFTLGALLPESFGPENLA
ncbi:cytidine deaminase [Betaproteobacteria bacterium GR16-43]|nr:cytidine deaminase [Betaproteobacteria bacterium GR16-43]